MQYITDHKLREKIRKRGYDPDTPGAAEKLQQLGINIGPQPDDPGITTGAKAFGSGIGTSISNLVRGTGSLAYAALHNARPGESGIETAARMASQPDDLTHFGTAPESPNEIAHPYIAAAGGLVPDVAALALTGGASEAALEGVPLLGRIVRAGAAADKLATGVLGGFSKVGIAGRALTTATTFGAMGAIRPGTAEERLHAAYEGVKSGGIFGALGAPSGIAGKTRFAREVLAGTAAGALGQPPIATPLPNVVSGALGGTLFGAFGLAKESIKRPLSEIKPPTTSPDTRPTERPPLAPEVKAVRKKVEKQAVIDATAAARNPLLAAQEALSTLSSIPNPTPEIQSQLDALKSTLTTSAPEVVPEPTTGKHSIITKDATGTTTTHITGLNAEEATAIASAPTTPTTTIPTPTAPPQPALDRTAKLPPDLSGAKPRYGYGDRLFTTTFDSDIDRAAYITAQKKPSPRDADYLAFVMKATGMPESAVRAHGAAIRNQLKELAKNATPDQTELRIENIAARELSAESATVDPNSGETLNSIGPAHIYTPTPPSSPTPISTTNESITKFAIGDRFTDGKETITVLSVSPTKPNFAPRIQLSDGTITDTTVAKLNQFGFRRLPTTDEPAHRYTPTDDWGQSRLSRLRSLLPGPVRRASERLTSPLTALQSRPEVTLGEIKTKHPVTLARGSETITLRDGTIHYNRLTGEWTLRQPTTTIPLTRADYTTIHRDITRNSGVKWAANILRRAGIHIGTSEESSHPIITRFLDLVHDSEEYKQWDSQLNGPTVPLNPPHFSWKRREYIDLLHAARFAEEHGGSSFGGSTPAEEAILRRAYSTLSRIFHANKPEPGKPELSDDELLARAYYGVPLSSVVAKGTHTYRLPAEIPEATAREMLTFLRSHDTALEDTNVGTIDAALAAVSGLSQTDFERYIDKVDDAIGEIKRGDPREKDVPVADAALTKLRESADPSQEDWKLLLTLAQRFVGDPTSPTTIPEETVPATIHLSTSPPPQADALADAKKSALRLLSGLSITDRAQFEDPTRGHFALTTALIGNGIHPYVAGDAARFALLRQSGRRSKFPGSYESRLADLEQPPESARPIERNTTPLTPPTTEPTAPTKKPPKPPRIAPTTIRTLNTLNAQLSGKLKSFEAHLTTLNKLHESIDKLSAKQRTNTLARLDKISTDIKTTQAEMQALRDQIATHTLSIDLDDARYRRNLADHNTARATLPDEVENEIIRIRRDIPLKTFEEALNRIGNRSKGRSPMTLEHLSTLPPDLAARHTALMLTAKKMLANATTPNGARHSFFTLRRFARAISGKPNADLYKYSLHAGLSGEPSNVIPSLITAASTYDDGFRIERKKTIPETLLRKAGAKLGKGRDYYRLTDLISGETHDYPTPETLALGMDYLTNQRALDPDLTPPGFVFQLRLDGNGPRLPASDGGASGEGYDLSTIPTTPLDPSRPTVNDLNYFTSKYLAIPSTTIKYIGRNFEAVFGHDFGIVETVRKITENINRAKIETNNALSRLGEEFGKVGVFKNYKRGLRMDAAARQVSAMMHELAQSGSSWEEQQAAFPDIAAAAANDHQLSNGEYKAVFTVWKQHADRLFTVGGIDRVAKKIPFFYYPLNAQYSRGPASFDPSPTNLLTKDAENPYFVKPRNTGAATLDPWAEHIRNEFGIDNHADFFRVAESYTHGVYKYLHNARDINHLSDIIKFTSKDGIAVLPDGIGQFLSQQLRRYRDEPSTEEVNETRGRGNRSIAIARRLNKISTALDKLDNHLIERTGIPDMLTNIAKKMGVKAIRGDSFSFAKTYMAMNRAKVFGANIMRATRDLTGTTVLEVGTRFDTATRGQAWWNTITKWEELKKRYIDKEALIRSDTELQNINVDPFAWRGLRTIQKVMGAPNQFNDTFTRIYVIRAAEIAVEKGLIRFNRAGRTDAAWSDLIEKVGIDFIATSRTELANLRGLAERNPHEFFRQVATLHQQSDVFVYDRHNAAPFYDSVKGRLLGQYGSWPVNMINSMYAMMRAPIDTHGYTPRALRRYLTAGIRYAAGAELIYSLGAFFNIDTSDWIPFIHNLFYTGGPALSQFNEIKDTLTDPVELRRLQTQPGLVVTRLARNIVPFPPDVTQNIFAQAWGVDAVNALQSHFGHSAASWRYSLGFPTPSDNHWDSMAAIAGFKPYIYPGHLRQPSGLNYLGGSLGRTAQDLLATQSKKVGVDLPPGSAQATRSFQPLVGGPRQ